MFFRTNGKTVADPRLGARYGASIHVLSLQPLRDLIGQVPAVVHARHLVLPAEFALRAHPTRETPSWHADDFGGQNGQIAGVTVTGHAGLWDPVNGLTDLGVLAPYEGSWAAALNREN